jgi:hypothetical protein
VSELREEVLRLLEEVFKTATATFSFAAVDQSRSIRFHTRRYGKTLGKFPPTLL